MIRQHEVDATARNLTEELRAVAAERVQETRQPALVEVAGGEPFLYGDEPNEVNRHGLQQQRP